MNSTNSVLGTVENLPYLIMGRNFVQSSELHKLVKVRSIHGFKFINND